MQTFSKLSTVVTAVVLAAATTANAAPSPNTARQLSGLPSLPFCVDGSLAGSLPTGINILTCSAGETCESITDVLNLPIVGSIISGILSANGVLDDLPVGLGLCA